MVESKIEESYSREEQLNEPAQEDLSEDREEQD
jgi:hypothetical protein